jgi:hypothetical protein
MTPPWSPVVFSAEIAGDRVSAAVATHCSAQFLDAAGSVAVRASFAPAKDTIDGSTSISALGVQSAARRDAATERRFGHGPYINSSIQASSIDKAVGSKDPNRNPNHLLSSALHQSEVGFDDCPFVMATESDAR